MYPRLTSEKGNVLNSLSDYIDYNLKSSLIDFTYYHGAFEYTRDATKDNFVSILNKSNNINNLWGLYCPKIISATSQEEASKMYDSIVEQSLSMGGKDVLKFDNEAFQLSKENLGIKYAWPKNDPNSGYYNLKIESIFGNLDYVLDIPDGMK